MNPVANPSVHHPFTAPRRGLGRWAGVAALVVATVAPVAHAQARDLFWSVGIASPGVTMGLSNAMPVVVAPSHLVAPPPMVVYPQAMMAPPAYGVAWAPPPPHARPWYGHRHRHHGHGDHRGWDDDERRGRDWDARPGHGWR